MLLVVTLLSAVAFSSMVFVRRTVVHYRKLLYKNKTSVSQSVSQSVSRLNLIICVEHAQTVIRSRFTITDKIKNVELIRFLCSFECFYYRMLVHHQENQPVIYYLLFSFSLLVPLLKRLYCTLLPTAD